uniref:OMP564 n=1 Tax=Helicobacter felis TaxID=214 RepID=A0A1M4NG48_HELFE|nr:OMP564 [Helicobacter felis ATCC 49179]
MGWMSFLCQKKSKNSPYCAKSSPFGMRFYALFNRQFGNHNTLQNYFAGGALDLLFNFLDNTTWTFWGLCGGSWWGKCLEVALSLLCQFPIDDQCGVALYIRLYKSSKWELHME